MRERVRPFFGTLREQSSPTLVAANFPAGDISQMIKMKIAGVTLMKAGLRPAFQWSDTLVTLLILRARPYRS